MVAIGEGEVLKGDVGIRKEEVVRRRREGGGEG